MACQEDPELRAAVLGASFTVPDGQPLVWALNALGHQLPDRVYGPELMERACARAARERPAASTSTAAATTARWPSSRATLRLRHPGLRIVGGHCPPFRALADAEEDAVAAEINRSGADVVWVGIGVPKQEKWMARMRDRLDAPVLVGVGAAFDFHAGLIPQAPDALQRLGLEWAFRLVQEPRRLWRRYLRYNPRFVLGFARQYVRHLRAAASLSAMSHDVAVIGLGRVGLPLAITFADHGLSVLGVDKDAERLETLRAGRMPFKEPGTEEPLARVLEAGRLALSERAADAAQADAIVLTLGTPTFSHIEIDMSRHPHGAGRAAAAPARGAPARAALHGRAAHDRVRRRLPGEEPRLPRRRGPLRRARARAHRRRPLHGGDRHAAVHRRRRRRGVGRARRAAVRGARRPDRADDARCRPSWPRSGPTSCATRRSRCRTC